MVCAGYVSFRDVKKGAWFMQHLRDVFLEQAEKEHLGDMLIEVITVNTAVNYRKCTLIGYWLLQKCTRKSYIYIICWLTVGVTL